MIAALLLVAVQAAPADPVHDVIQQVIHDVQDGKDFTQGAFKDAVTPVNAAKLATLKPCGLGKVMRTQGDRMAMIQWSCPAESGLGHPSTMIMLDGGKATSIELVSYVQVPTRGN